MNIDRLNFEKGLAASVFGMMALGAGNTARHVSGIDSASMAGVAAGLTLAMVGAMMRDKVYSRPEIGFAVLLLVLSYTGANNALGRENERRQEPQQSILISEDSQIGKAVFPAFYGLD